MTHIDEHILELYLLGDEKALRQKEVIERHLSECLGCRELAQSMQSFYADVKAGMEESVEIAPPSVTSIVRTHDAASQGLWHKPKLPVAARWSVLERWSPSILKSFWLRAGNYAYQRPVAASMVSLAIIGALIFFVKINVSTAFKDSRPGYFNYNTGQNKIEIYNSRNDLLWSIPSYNLAKILKDQIVPQTYIVDLDNDGSKEIVTGLPVGSQHLRVLSVFNADGSRRFQFDFPTEEISFRNVKYSLKPEVCQIVPVSHSNAKTYDIIVESVTGRSPNFIARISSTGILLGKMWHFGGMSSLAADTLFRKPKILVGGLDDVDEEQGERRGIVYLIDPEKIVDETESLASCGFGFPTASCESIIVQFPSSDMNKALHLGQTVSSISRNGQHEFIFSVWSYPDPTLIGSYFQFFSDDSLKFKEVKPSDTNAPIHANLKAQGKIHSTLDQKYHENLKNGVRYWNGTSWQKGWIMLHQ